MYKKREECAICKNHNLHNIMDYGEVPLAGNFPTLEEKDSVEKYELKLIKCLNCTLVQTDSIIDSHTLFNDYRYMSSIGLTKHFTEQAEFLKDSFGLNENSEILEIGSNDGVLLKPLMDLGLKPMGIDPSVNISQIAKDKGCSVIVDYFSEEAAEHYYTENIFNLIVSNNCFAHIDDIHSIMRGVKYALKNDGHFVIEVHYLQDLIDKLQYETVYHEHLYYYTITSLTNLFKQYNMSIVKFDRIPNHSGSIRVTVSNNNLCFIPTMDIIKEEEKINTDKFGELSRKHIKSVQDTLKNLKSQGKRIVGYGASGRANIFINVCGITDEIDYVVDESPERVGRYIAGTDIEIMSKETLLNDNPDYVFILAWNFSDMIMDKLKEFDYKYIIAFPEIRII